MTDTYEFLKLVLDTIPEHIVVIDNEGNILFVNRSWSSFGQNNESLVEGDWTGLNYLKIYDEAAASGDDFGLKAASGIRKVINSEQLEFSLEYPCHSPNDKRWFMMRVTSFSSQEMPYFVISHQNITIRKLAEYESSNLSRIDTLTNVANRKCFDEFLKNEWNRCARLRTPVSLAIINADNFKLINDTYSHQVGDDCLKTLGNTLDNFAQRPSDLCARFDEDEFAIIYGNTSPEISRQLIERLNNKIRSLGISNEKAPTSPTLTVSIGLASMLPDKNNGPQDLIDAAIKLTSVSKGNGKNQVLTA